MPKPVRRKEKKSPTAVGFNQSAPEADETDQKLADELYSLSNQIHNLATRVGLKATQITMRLADNKNIPF